MAELEAGLDALASGRGSLFLVTGEPGIGKTRLADELGRAAAERGVEVHWGRAWEAGGAPSYWLLIQALRSISRDAEPLGALLGSANTPVERFQLFEAVDAFLRAAGPAPRLLVLDDLHAADPSSLTLLHFLVRDLRSRPLMVVGTYRDAEARLAPEVMQLLAQIAREACVLPLRRLDRAEVGEFLALATGRAPDDGQVDALYRRTEGNPLFLRELLKLGGALSRSPDGIREVVRARLSLLQPSSRGVLEAAAVIGREFTVAPLAAAAGVPEIEARALLEPAANAAIVEPLDQPPRWRFTHVLLRQGLYEDLPAERRAALHRAVAAELERRPEGTPLAELAHHLLNAVPAVAPFDAGRAALRAAERALELLAFEDARELYASAEKSFEGADSAELGEAILGRGLSYMRAAEVERGRAECGRAAALARRLGSGELFARAVLGNAYEHAPDVRDAELVGSLEEALARLPAGDGALRARCMAQLAAERHPEPDTEPLLDLARAAVAMARRLGEPYTLRSTLSAASLAFGLFADPLERRELNQEALRLALAANDSRLAVRAQMFLGGALLEMGDVSGARAALEVARSMMSALRHDRFDWILLMMDTVQAQAAGRFDEAQVSYQAAEQKARGDEARGAGLAATPIVLTCVMERYDDVPGIVARARARFGSLPHELGACIGELFIAQLYGHKGDRAEAAAQLARLEQLPLFGAIEEPLWLATLAEACHLVGDRRLAERLYAALLPRAHRFIFHGPLTACVEAPYGRKLGLLAETLGRLDDAVRHFDDAEARIERSGMRSLLARVRYELARTLVARGRSADRERAARLVSDARALADELGQTALVAQFAELTAELGEAPVVHRNPGHAFPAFSLAREGNDWALRFGQQLRLLRDSRGMQLLAELVANTGQELHVLQLASSRQEPRSKGDAGPALDREAIQSYRQRLFALRGELEEAEQFADPGRADKARAEMDFLTQELARAVGLGGRERRVGDPAERARTAVQKRLREAIQRIGSELPELGRHLEQSIHTGAFCGYLPDGRRR